MAVEERPVGGAVDEPRPSIMQIEKIGTPAAEETDELSKNCKFDAVETASVFGDSGPATDSASALGGAIVKTSECNGKAADLVLSNMFGQMSKTIPTGEEVGVSLKNPHSIPLGSLQKRSLRATTDACEDFGRFLFDHLEPKRAGTFTSQDAGRTLKSFGLCLESIGKTTAIQGCEMGNLQQNGTTSAAKICKEIQGPEKPDMSCSIM
jgi:hypothetical protein